VENSKTEFVNGKNCFVVGTEEELADLLNKDPSTSRVVKGEKELLRPHIEVNWPKELSRV
jgi:hypothetical protein